MKEYSQIANLLGGSGVDSNKRKEILQMVKRLCRIYDEEKGYAERMTEINLELSNLNRELEKKLEKIREILSSNSDSYDYGDWGDDR